MAVAFDAKATAVLSGGASSYSTQTLTTLTVGTGSNRALVAMISFYAPSGQTVSSIKWDNAGTPQNMTLISGYTEATSKNRIELWGLVNPTSGNKQMLVTYSASASYQGAYACSFTGADQTGGTTTFYSPQQAHSSSGSGSSVTSASIATGDMAVDAVTENGTVVGTCNKTLLDWDQSAGFLGQYTAGAGSTITFTSTIRQYGWMGCNM